MAKVADMTMTVMVRPMTLDDLFDEYEDAASEWEISAFAGEGGLRAYSKMDRKRRAIRRWLYTNYGVPL